MSTSSIKRQIRRFHVVVVQWTSKKCTKKRDARAELLFWSLNLLFFEVVVVVVVVVVVLVVVAIIVVIIFVRFITIFRFLIRVN